MTADSKYANDRPRGRRAGAVASAVCAVIALLSSPAQGSPAKDVIERFHAALIAVMKDAESLGPGGRYERLAPEVARTFNLARMIQIATGSYWRKAQDADRERLVAAFARLSSGTYADRFDGYSGQAFETINESAGPRGTVLVATQIRSPDDAPVPITYVMVEADGRWAAIDVLLDDAISELAVRRSEYHQILRQRGPGGLIVELNRKADLLIGAGAAR